MRRLALLLAAGLALSGCGLRPLYADGNKGAAASMLSQISIAPISGRDGWLVRTALVDRIGDHGDSARYRLEVKLDDQIQGLGLRSDATTTRERRTLRARYKLVDTVENRLVVDTTAGSDVGIDIVNSEYATVAAEQTALERLAERVADQIVTRIATGADKASAQ